MDPTKDISPIRLFDGTPGHAINTYKRCPKDPTHDAFEVRNYNETFRDGDVHCAVCGAYIRMYDAG